VLRYLTNFNHARYDEGNKARNNVNLLSGSLCDHKARTAVVFVIKALNECKAIRLAHLLQTAGPNVDVWLLHNHITMINNETEKDALEASIEYIRQLEREHMLHSESQANKTIARFDTKISGSSKSSFLRWVVQHPEYKNAWQIEDDVFSLGISPRRQRC
jgi:hypothetical protein